MNKKRALVAMSGGVDSAASAILMQNAGYDCIGVTMKLIANEEGGKCCSLKDVNDAKDAAFRLDIPHYVLNYTDGFTNHVIKPFIDSYVHGETPNPCIECNRHLKFSLLLHRARELDADKLVTGHYARIEKSGGRWILKKGVDKNKDQSYVLYMMNQEALSMTEFPLGGLTKSDARALAKAKGFSNAEKKESQDICFVLNGDYAGFIENYTGRTFGGGDIINTEGDVLGQHKGLIRYTIGQRRGLGVAHRCPLYVIKKNLVDNTLVIGEESSLYSKSLIAKRINLIACDDILQAQRLLVKVQYQHIEQWARVEQVGDDEIRVDFEEPQRAIASGQAAVFYDGDTVVGGGAII